MTPTAISLIGSAFGGALITGLVGLATHLLAGKREHKKWLREEKLEAYSDFLTVARNTEWEIRGHELDDVSTEDVHRALRSINHFRSKLLAPQRINELIDRYHRQLMDSIILHPNKESHRVQSRKAIDDAAETRSHLSLVMADDLGIRPDSRGKKTLQRLYDWWYRII